MLMGWHLLRNIAAAELQSQRDYTVWLLFSNHASALPAIRPDFAHTQFASPTAVALRNSGGSSVMSPRSTQSVHHW
jgi:hypothetical protein